jgi:hypothetical protein
MDGDALEYSVVGHNGQGTAEIIGGNTLKYTPAAADAGRTVAVEVKARDGSADSVGNVIVNIAVAALPSDDPPAVNIGGGGGGGGGLPAVSPAPAATAPALTAEPEPAENDTVNPGLVSQVFSDISATAWFTEAVQFVYSLGYFQGVSETDFSPNVSMTRGMFITVLGRIAGIDAGLYTGDIVNFSDATVGDWFFPYVEWGYENGVISGIGNGAFGPNLAVTREQLAVMLYRYAIATSSSAAISGAASLNAFADSGAVSDWAETALLWMTENGILQGKPGGRLDPRGLASRAEVATIAMRAADILR